jgi:exosortase B
MNSERFSGIGSRTFTSTSSPFLQTWWPVLTGLLVLYAPTYFDLSRTLWTREEHIHGPMVLLAVSWLFWRQRSVLLLTARETRTLPGSVLLGLGLFLYAIGRSQEILLFEVGSQIPVLMGALLIAQGIPSIRVLWFPLFFFLFMIPLPGVLVDAMTGPLKQQVSVLAESILYAAGYPIARSGVVLTIGPYQLLVADACSGLNSMLSLSALGLLYLYLLHDRNWLRNGLLIASILPIAFAANVVRVIVLVLVTYHFGDAAGQGFLHGFAGIVLFVVAISGLFTLDAVLGVLSPVMGMTARAG